MHRILIVEDTPNFQNWLIALLRREFTQSQVSSVTNGRSASVEIERLCTSAGDPQHRALVILDLGLPENESDPMPRSEVGFRILEQLKARSDAPKVIVMSSHSPLEAECLAKGADGFVSKETADPGGQLLTVIKNLFGLP